MNELRVLCALGCGEPVDPLDRFTYQRITGWERKAGRRTSGKHGGSDIRLRQPLDEFAHPHCVDKAKQTGNATQDALTF